MSKTIDAMKMALYELKQLQIALSRNPGLGFNVQPSVIEALREAIAAEEAQTVEPVPDVLDTINRSEYGNKLRLYKKDGYAEGWAACMSAWTAHMTRMNAATEGLK